MATHSSVIRIRITFRDAVVLSMLSLGLVSLILSISYSSYVLAFIGLSLAFWGALLLYIEPTKYVKLELLNSASISAIVNIERILVNAKANSEGIYLPPKRLQDFTSSLVFISTKGGETLPTASETNPEILESKNPAGLLITPPGLAMSKLFEKELGKPFTDMRIEDLQTQLPRLFDRLQITKNLTIQKEKDSIIVQIKKHVFEDLCRETAKLERTNKAVGCLLSSALACAFAKATGQPIILQKEETFNDRTTAIRYRILEDKEC